MGSCYTVAEAMYSKGRFVVRCPSDNGWKSRAGKLAGAISRERWTGREGGYSLSASQLKRFEKLYADGWSANPFDGSLIPPEVV